MIAFMNNGEGSKHAETKALNLVAIAKLVRADIKAALAEGVLVPSLKCSVTISRYSMGQSISIRITGFGEQIWTDEFIGSNPRVCFEGERRTAIAQSTVHVLERILRGYNRIERDPHCDYANVRFHGNVDFDHAATKADRTTVAKRLGILAA